MSPHERSVEGTLAAFDEYLRRTRGLRAGTRANYVQVVRTFLVSLFPDGRIDADKVTLGDVVSHIGLLAERHASATVAGAATALRVFFRFSQAAGLRQDRLDDAVPMVPRQRVELVRHLTAAQLEQLLASLDSSSPRGRRDRAIILCIARLGLRPGEVVRLSLDDLDWVEAVVRVRSRKTGHGALLPLPVDVGSALADYLRDGRPVTTQRVVFVLHRDRIGAPISTRVVGRAVDRALTRAGIDAPTRGGNLLRHSLATGLLARGASLQEIADLMGHRSLDTTRIYAAGCRQVAGSRYALALDADRAMNGVGGGLVADYLVLRRSLGYRSAVRERSLRAFGRFLDDQDHRGPILLETSLAWAMSTASSDPHNPARRLAAVRGFLRHQAGLDGATEVPPPGLLGSVGHRSPPHVYSAVEIADLIAAAARLAPAGGLRPHAYATLFGLIACTGLRIEETLGLTCVAVDLTNAVLTVHGKGGRIRLVPLHPSALPPLRDYADHRDRRYGRPLEEAAFFRTDRSDRIRYSAAQHAFTTLRRELGWTPVGRTRQPRIHDLRHAIAVHRIQTWHEEGVDVDAHLPLLATYLGHAEIRALYWYLSAVPELMSIIGARFATFAGQPTAGE